MKPIPDYADMFVLDDWRSAVKESSFIPYDGSGYYATETEMDPKSDVWDGTPAPEWATHVAWFNK